ncbi:hypothetical protein SAMN04488554_1065 [Ruania alba]|uniref:Uncharacterized protein n=1 Tax=Ruania alba TaxID=648782 RepID=A0A1H5ELY4_9MICO|nr:hypothetical protein SAMN04488554_1065 [Ruania alba]
MAPDNTITDEAGTRRQLGSTTTIEGVTSG